MEREIFYNDLNEDGKCKVLDLYNCTESELDMNEPIAVIEFCQWTQFVNKYKPIKNPQGSDEWDDCLFEDIKIVAPDCKIWTYYNGNDGNEYISSGFDENSQTRGYFITEKEWTGIGEVFCVWEEETSEKLDDYTSFLDSEEESLRRHKDNLEDMKKHDPVSLLTTGQDLIKDIRQIERTIKGYEETIKELELKQQRENKRWTAKQELKKLHGEVA